MENTTVKRKVSSPSPVEEDEDEKGKKAMSGEEYVIAKLMDIDICYYLFQSYNALKSPYYRGGTHQHSQEFAKYEIMRSPAEEADLGLLKTHHFNHDQMLEITHGFSEELLLRKSPCGRQFKGHVIDRLPSTDDVIVDEVIVKRWDFFFPIASVYGSYPERFYCQLEFLLNPLVASHPNMAKLKGFCCEKMLALVLDLKLNQTLHDLIPQVRFNWNRRMKVAKQVAKTLQFFHKNQIALCNFFAPCINVDEDDHIKLFEFDRAVNLANHNFPVKKWIVGARGSNYDPPEYASPTCFKREWFFTTDVYHFGLLLMELTLAKCVDDTCVWVEWAKIAFAKGETYSRYNSSLTPYQSKSFELAVKCVQEVPEVRPKMDEVVEQLDKIFPVP